MASKIKFGNVKGNVTISENQKGGITAHEINKQEPGEKKSFLNSPIALLIGLISAILGIAGYFGFQPNTNKLDTNEKIEKIDSTRSHNQQKTPIIKSSKPSVK